MVFTAMTLLRSSNEWVVVKSALAIFVNGDEPKGPGEVAVVEHHDVRK